MKKVDQTPITGSIGLIEEKKTFQHVYASYTEAFTAIEALLPISHKTGKLVILSGCVMTGSNPGPRTMTAGVAYYQGEIYIIPAASFTTTGAQIGVFTLQDVNFGVPESTLTNGTTVHMLTDFRFVLSAASAGTGTFDENSSNVVRVADGFVVKSSLNTTRIIVPIGDWNMDTDVQKNISITSYPIVYTNVIGISVVVYGDAAYGGVFNPLTFTDVSGSSNPEVGVSLNSTQIVLQRRLTGFFDSTNFDQTGFNRGYVIVELLA